MVTQDKVYQEKYKGNYLNTPYSVSGKSEEKKEKKGVSYYLQKIFSVFLILYLAALAGLLFYVIFLLE